MHVLISNDDGVDAPGIRILAEALGRLGRVTLVAPDRDRSGASNSLTLDQPIRVARLEEGIYRVAGTPTDCVHLALCGLLDDDPDIVVSGINNAANLGDDVIYSGTVAAAMEGRFLGLPAIAVSLVGHRATHFDTAARVACDLVRRLEQNRLPGEIMLNVNVPDRPYEELTGIVATRLGFRHKSEPLIKTSDPMGKTIYWIGPAGPGQDAGPGTDFAALEAGAVAITPLKVDLTRHEAIGGLTNWLKA